MAAHTAPDTIDIPDTRVTTNGKAFFTSYHVVAAVSGEHFDVFRRYTS
jgi:hypothetical protein